jgi:uncharacterized protein YjbI with pentapeptide repeats
LTPFSAGDDGPDKPAVGGVQDVANALKNALLTRWTQVDLSNTDLHGVHWPSVALGNVYAPRIDLRAGDLLAARLRGASLENSLLNCANLRGAKLSGAHLQGAVFAGADLRGADLSDATGLTPTNLTAIDFNARTTFPSDISKDDLSKARYRGQQTCVDTASYMLDLPAAPPVAANPETSVIISPAASPTAVGDASSAPTAAPSR